MKAGLALVRRGWLRTDGFIIGDVVSNGTLFLDDTVTGLTITGNFTQGSSGETSLDIWSSTSFNTINITGFANYSGSLSINFTQGFVPAAGETFELITAGGGIIDFQEIGISGLGPDVVWQRIGTGDSYVLQIVSVPEPSQVGLLLAGLLGGIILVRRRFGGLKDGSV